MATGDVSRIKREVEPYTGTVGQNKKVSSLVIANLLGRQQSKTRYQRWPNKARATVEYVLLLKGKS